MFYNIGHWTVNIKKLKRYMETNISGHSFKKLTAYKNVWHNNVQFDATK